MAPRARSRRLVPDVLRGLARARRRGRGRGGGRGRPSGRRARVRRPPRGRGHVVPHAGRPRRPRLAVRPGRARPTAAAALNRGRAAAARHPACGDAPARCSTGGASRRRGPRARSPRAASGSVSGSKIPTSPLAPTRIQPATGLPARGLDEDVLVRIPALELLDGVAVVFPVQVRVREVLEGVHAPPDELVEVRDEVRVIGQRRTRPATARRTGHEPTASRRGGRRPRARRPATGTAAPAARSGSRAAGSTARLKNSITTRNGTASSAPQTARPA